MSCCSHDHEHSHSHNHGHSHKHQNGGHDHEHHEHPNEDKPLLMYCGSSDDLKDSMTMTGVTVTTSMVCGGICCAQEVPIIQQILKEVPGVVKATVNVAMKKVIVEHNTRMVSVADIASKMNNEGFEVKKLDTTEPPSPVNNGITNLNSSLVTTKMVCGGICCAQEIPIIRRIMAEVNGVTNTTINVALKKVIVEHDVALVSVAEVAKKLNQEGFEVKKLETTEPAAEGTGPGTGKPTDGRSIFHVPDIEDETYLDILKSLFSTESAVITVSIDPNDCHLVRVDHNMDKISANNIRDMFEDFGFSATIQQDAFFTDNNTPAAKAAAKLTTNGNIPSKVESSIEVEVLPNNTTQDDNNNNNNNNASNNLADTIKEYLRLLLLDTPLPHDELKEAIQSIQTKQQKHGATQLSIHHNPLSLPLHRMVTGLEAESAGRYKIRIIKDGADSVEWNFPTLDGTAQNKDAHNLKTSGDSHGHEEVDVPTPKLPIVLSGVCWIASYFSYLGGIFVFLKYFALLSVVLGVPGIARKAYNTMRRFMFDTNCLMLFAAIGAIGLGDYQEAAAVTFLFAISDYLEAIATSRARNALSALVHLRPEFAWLVHPSTKQHLLVPASAVPVGALVSVKTGDKVPCDGVVVEGESTINEASLTGESRPVKKVVKDKVSGGTINCGMSHLLIQTTTTADKSAVARLIQLVEEAQANTSQTEKLVDSFAKVYTPIVVVSGLLMCTIPWFFGPKVGAKWTESGLVFLVVGCPCALVISTPVTYVAGLAATAQKGIVIKGGAHLETLGLVKSICFDKTGTLTQGSYALVQLVNVGEKITREAALETLMLMEEQANHPLGLALLDGARNEGVSLPKGKVVKNHTFLAGEGLSGEIDGLKVFVGNKRLFNRLGLLEEFLTDEMDNMIYNWERMAGTVGFMSIEGSGIVCAYCVADLVREESTEVVDELQNKDGISVFMLTGDSQDAANAIGGIIGLADLHENVKSELLPEDKLTIVSNMKDAGEIDKQSGVLCSIKRHRILMVGDGVNDAPALAMADVGVAMGVGAALALETADVTLLDSNLHKLLFSVRMGRRVLWKIRENIIFSLLVKALMLGLAVFDHVPLWAAIVSDVGSMLCVTLNGMTLLPTGKIDRDEMGDVGNVSFRSRVEEGESDRLKKKSSEDAYGTFSEQESAALMP